MIAVALARLKADMPEAEYHAHPSLSVSGAKKLLDPYCPAIYRYEQDNGQQHKDAFDFGSAVHTLVLGVGAELRPIDADDWRSKYARESRAQAYEDGVTPLLAADHQRATVAANAVLTHDIAGELFRSGYAERSLFWEDEEFGVTRRARPDWQTTIGAGRNVLVDLKTSVSANPKSIAKSVANFGYHMQHAWYVDAARAVLDIDPAFLFVFVEKDAPHLVTVCELDADAVAAGRNRNTRALAIYAECQRTGIWPGHTEDIPVISLPGWAIGADQ